ncbi:MAG: hypothetical protein DRJ01_07280 [Bacteroidetes bacterium]|nr:MAG: hypothetical protein DRJ01_07280 [Bacteroidota bacterium]
MLRITKYLFISFILVNLFFFSAFSQIKSKRVLSDKIFFGGNLGLQFGTITQVDVSPLVGYRITDDLSAGVGLSYQYYKDSRWDFVNMETNIFGCKIFGKYFIYEDLFLHVEDEALNIETKYFDVLNKYPNQDRFWLNCFMVGGGYRQRLGERSSVTITALWNLNQTANTPYSNPVIRLGFNF